MRDEFEFGLLDAVGETSLPVLGICRGHQVINVHAGGSLNQHVPEHAAFDQTITTRSHEVFFESGSELSRLYGILKCFLRVRLIQFFLGLFVTPVRYSPNIF